jgi:hypothetical protein
VVRDLPFGRETLKSGGGQPVTPSVKIMKKNLNEFLEVLIKI